MKKYQNFVLTLIVMFISVGSVSVSANDQIDTIRYIEGRWNMESSFFEDGKWGVPKASTLATGQSVLGGAFIRMELPVTFPDAIFQFEMTLSYDRFHNVYRVTFLDDINGYMDVYSGQMKDDVLTVTNANTGTSFPDGQGGVIYGKLEIQQAKNGFQIDAYTSSNMKEPFAPYMKLKFISASKK